MLFQLSGLLQNKGAIAIIDTTTVPKMMINMIEKYKLTTEYILYSFFKNNSVKDKNVEMGL